MRKNGFVFVETIVAVVVLTSSLLLLYSTFNDVLRMEKTRVYYDDVSFIYRTYYLKESLTKLNMSNVKNNLKNSGNYFVTIGSGFTDLFMGVDVNYQDDFNEIIDFLNVKQMIILKQNKINNLKKCSSKCIFDKNECKSGEPFESCNLLGTISNDFQKYLKTINIDIICDYLLVAEYEINNQKFYSWVSV